MYWEKPTWLLAWWLIPALGWLLVAARRRKFALAARFAEPIMLARLTPVQSSVRSAFKATALLVGLALLIAGAARPRWGVYFETVHAKGVDLFVLLDVSRSMLAEDVAPNRLMRAKSDIRDLLQKLSGDRVGLIVFAGAPVVKVPLTTDHAFLQSALDEVDPLSAPRGGSLIGDAIRKAITSLGPRGDRDQVIVLITDGEDQDSYPTDAAKQAAEAGIKMFTVGLGDAGEGRRVPVRDKSGNLTYLQYEGREVWSKMDEKLLKEIAVSTNGAYVPAKTLAYDLGEIYTQHLQKLTRGELASEKRKRYGEQYQLFLVAGLVLLMLDELISRFPKVKTRERIIDDREATIARGSVSGQHAAKSKSPLPMSVICWQMLFAIVVGALMPVRDAQADAARDIRTGVANHQAGKFEQAEKSFAEAEKQLPKNPLALYDRACSLAALGKLDEAEDLFEQTKSSDDSQVIINSHYNLGCLDGARAKAKFGDKPEDASSAVREEGIKLLEQAAMHYRDCLHLDPSHASARHNLELIRLWIKHMNDVWRQRDRDKARQDLGLLEFLLMIEQRQIELLRTTNVLAVEQASPKRRQAAAAASRLQRELADEISPLAEKIREAIRGNSQPGQASQQPAAPPTDAQVDEAAKQFDQWTEQSRSEMSRAAIDLTTDKLEAAAEREQTAVKTLNEIYRAVAPLEHLLQRSIEQEEKQVEDTRPLTDAKASQASQVSSTALHSAGDLPWIQSRIASWIEMLEPKAASQLKQVEAQLAASPPEKPTDATTAAAPPTAANGADSKAYFQKVIKLGPQAHQAATEAHKSLTNKLWSPALDKEEEVVRLLKEIADSAPKKNQDEEKKQEQQPEQPKDKNQDKDNSQDKKQQDKEKQDKEKRNEQKQDEQKQDKQKQDKKENESTQEKNQSPPNKPPSASRQAAEAALRRVRQREREHKEREKELQARIRGVVPVDKDW